MLGPRFLAGALERFSLSKVSLKGCHVWTVGISRVYQVFSSWMYISCNRCPL
jgi:hypothetical protein